MTIQCASGMPAKLFSGNVARDSASFRGFELEPGIVRNGD